MTGIEAIDLFRHVRSLSGPDRETDKMIADMVGYRRKPKTAPSLDGKGSKRTLWVISKYDEARNVPPFTGSLDAALELAETVSKGAALGASWEPGTASARIGAGPFIQAPTPALALCLSALFTFLKSQSEANSSLR